ncbi:hypothetical protein D3C83_106860 [compost metagenome]
MIEHAAAARRQIGRRRRLLLERPEAVQHVVGVDALDGGKVRLDCVTDGNGWDIAHGSCSKGLRMGPSWGLPKDL